MKGTFDLQVFAGEEGAEESFEELIHGRCKEELLLCGLLSGVVS